MYGITATHYLTGIAPGLLLLRAADGDLPRPASGGPQRRRLAVAGRVRRASTCMQILLAFATLGSFRWQVLMLAAVSFPIYVRALINAVLRREQKWHVTGPTTAVALTVQLHHPAGADLRVPAADLGGRGLAGPAPGRGHPRGRLEHHEHPDPRRLHGRRLAGGPTRRAGPARTALRAADPPRRCRTAPARTRRRRHSGGGA